MVQVESCFCLVEPIARATRRSLPPSYELDDLIQAGYLGLLSAASSYRDCGFPFKSWARLKIRGAILDYVRREWRAATAVSLPQALRASELPAPLLLDNLTPDQGKVITLIYVAGESCEAIGRRRALGVGPRRVQQLHRQALAKLKRAA
jgi:DNA-directed RNA polymerase specialized sigma subunit